MFGLSLGEIVLLLIVGVVVVGPKNLPSMMRTAGQWVAKLRRMSGELRTQSGIDELIRIEGLEKEMQELRALTRMNMVDSLMGTGAAPAAALGAMAAAAPLAAAPFARSEPLREREYPLVGCDAYDALADDFVPYPPAAASIIEADAPAAASSVQADAAALDVEAAAPEPENPDLLPPSSPGAQSLESKEAAP